MTITENINRIKQAKADIKEAIIAKGVEVADDVRIDGYAEKIGEIKQGGGGSQFAIDYGEEIYTNNAYSMTAEQEDIDYYNQIQAERAAYAAGTGGRSDAEIQADPEFKRKIAWWPKGMELYGNKTFANFINIRTVPNISITSGSQYFINTTKLQIVDNVDVSAFKGYLSYFFKNSSIRNLDISSPAASAAGVCEKCFHLTRAKVKIENVKDLYGAFIDCINLIDAEIIAPSATSLGDMFQRCNRLKRAIIKSSPSSVSNMLNGTSALEVFELDVSNVNSNVAGWDTTALRVATIKGLHVGLSIISQSLELDSVKYILDNCQARADGAAYTLTLHANVKAAFMAKCTEGDENYDAEYAATLAAANAKGLTIA
ncbi:MAG: hypothetical protein U0L19_11020 [Bacteroidales bacterium]|nr:hypothetical protein [Bacteroidales bacterium]